MWLSAAYDILVLSGHSANDIILLYADGRYRWLADGFYICKHCCQARVFLSLPFTSMILTAYIRVRVS